MKKTYIHYDYVVHHISEGNSQGYKAIIPAFHAVVFGDDLVDLEKGVALAIEEEIRSRRSASRKALSIPKPGREQAFSGKFMLRLDPDLHERLALEAKARGKSLNAYIQERVIS